MNVKLIVDSACDLPRKIIEKYDIEVLPFNIIIDNKEYLDGKEISTKEVYKAIKNGKFPGTNQVSPSTYKKCFEKYAKNNISCIYISFSSQLSGAYQTSRMIADRLQEEYPNFDIDIIDSRGGSTATGLVVYQAARMIEEGKPKNEIVEASKFNSSHTEHIFTLDNLKYLAEGGRIKKSSAFIGGLLNIKPILEVRDGKIDLLDKIRGKTRVLNKMLDIMAKRSVEIKDEIIGISHADDLDIALQLKEMIKDRFGHQKFFINLIGSVLGVHLGIGGVGIFFMNKKPKKYYS